MDIISGETVSLKIVLSLFISLTSLLMANPLTVVAKVFSNTLIFLLQKLLMYLPYFKIEILMSY